MINYHYRTVPPAQFEVAQFDDAEDDDSAYNNMDFLRAQHQQYTNVAVPENVTPNRSRCNTDESWTSNMSTLTTITTASSTGYAIEVRPKDRNENDVLLGRGRGPNNFIGNKRFRELVAQYQQKYFELKRHEKPVMAAKVAALVGKMQPAGRFLRLDTATGMWRQVMSEQEAVRKTGQLLREGVLQRQKKRSNRSDDEEQEKVSSPSRGPLKKRHLLTDQMHSLCLSRNRG